jgi:hypothetical protein
VSSEGPDRALRASGRLHEDVLCSPALKGLVGILEGRRVAVVGVSAVPGTPPVAIAGRRAVLDQEPPPRVWDVLRGANPALDHEYVKPLVRVPLPAASVTTTLTAPAA